MKLLLIGKNSFISQNILFYLKNKVFIKNISYEKFKNINLKEIENFDYICNCSITKNYSSKKYNKKFDNDLILANRIKGLNVKYIFLSSRKIYHPGKNLDENSKKKPDNNYSKNKLISEKKLNFTLKKKLIILRISNLIGKLDNIKKKRKISNTFIYNFYNYKKKGKIIYYENYFKDFLSVEQFSKIFFEILKKNLYGVYNVSLGKKIYISEIIRALTKNKKNIKLKRIKIKSNDNFFLNNQKLLKKIKLKILKKDLLNYCYKI